MHWIATVIFMVLELFIRMGYLSVIWLDPQKDVETELLQS